jgi:hypothetical protein
MSLDSAAADVFSVTLPVRPYPGLRPFGKDEWPIFFGREQMIDDVVGRLVRQRLLVVHGDSGCGKSSLIRAGVLPRLEQDTARGGRRWITRVMTPGDEPLVHLADALADTPGADAPGASDGGPGARRLQLRRILNCGRDGSPALVDAVCGTRDPFVCLLIDQFEEVFAHARRRGPQQAGLLIEQILGLQALQSDRLFVVLTMRSEFLGACAQFEGFATAVNETQYLLPRMQHTDLLRAIREPATLYDGEIAIDLAERLIAEARGSQDELPLIQHGLMQMYEASPARGRDAWRLTLDDYRNPRGLAGLLSDHADAVMAQVEPDDRGRDGTRVTEDLFRALTDINADGHATRYPRRLADLVAITGAGEAAVRRVVDAFRVEGVSFMRPYGTDPIALDDYVDISHEALLRCWQKIDDRDDGWLTREFKNGLVWRSLLVQADSFGRDPANVLSAASAEERHRWLQRRNEAWSQRYGGRWQDVVALVDASMAARARQLQRDVDERTREEQARLRDEQARLKEQTLKSELAAATEKARRAKVFRWALVVSLVLLGLAVASAVSAYFDRAAAQQSAREARAAEQKALRAAKAAQDAEASERYERRKAQETADKIAKDFEGLKAAAAQSPVYAALQQRIDDVGSAINGVAVVPRVYLHISDESQRAAARELQRRIESARLGDYAIVVPGIQRVNGAPQQGILRCFVADECQKYGGQLLTIVNGQLAEPKLVLQDFSRTYTPDGGIRALHFEIYFPKGTTITPIPLDTKKSAY